MFQQFYQYMFYSSSSIISSCLFLNNDVKDIELRIARSETPTSEKIASQSGISPNELKTNTIDFIPKAKTIF